MTSLTRSESDRFKMDLKCCPVSSLLFLVFFSAAFLIYFILACFIFRLR